MAERTTVEKVVVDPAFWRGKRVLVTGHTGFKGAWLCLWLQKLGAHAFGYSLPPQTNPSLYAVAEVAAGMAGAVTADICDLAAVTAFLRRARPDIVIHMAAQAIVLRSYEDPIETFSTNVVGTVTLLAALRAVPSVRVVVAVTSDKCYENREWLWGYRETDPLGGHDPYSASKAAAELAVSSMRLSYFNPAAYASHQVGVASARAGNVIGGGDWAEHRLVPDMMRALIAGKPGVIRNPDAVRPWQHVLEPLSGYLSLAAALWRDGANFAGGWNFGPLDANARPVSWIADCLGQLWNGTSPWAPADGARKHEHTHLRLDTSKARSLLGWAPVWPLETTLQSVVDWHRAHLEGATMRDCVDAQIDQFARDAAKLATPGLPTGQSMVGPLELVAER